MCARPIPLNFQQMEGIILENCDPIVSFHSNTPNDPPLTPSLAISTYTTYQQPYTTTIQDNTNRRMPGVQSMAPRQSYQPPPAGTVI